MRVKFSSTKHSSAGRYFAVEFLEHDKARLQLARFLHDCRRKQASAGALREFIVAVEVTFARGTSHHQRARAHEARPQAANEIRQPSESRFGADQQIQIEDKERLDGANLAAASPER